MFFVYYQERQILSDKMLNYHKQELHIKGARLDNAMASLKKAGILSEHNSGKGKKIRISLSKDMINATIPYLYKMREEKEAKAKTIKELVTFFNYYPSKKCLREKVNESILDNVHEGKFSITAADKTNDITADNNNDGNDTCKKEEKSIFLAD